MRCEQTAPREVAWPADPDPAFYSLQADQRVCWSAERKAWVVTGFEEVLEGLRSDQLCADRDRRRFGGLSADAQAELEELREFYKRWPLFSDSPYHAKARGLAATALAGASTTELGGRVAALCESAAVDARRDPAPVELVSRFARPVALGATGLLAGLSPEHLSELESTSAPLIDFVGPPDSGLAEGRQAQRSLEALTARVGPLLEERSRSQGTDLISQVGRLAPRFGCDPGETLAVCVSLLVDSHGPIANAIASGALLIVSRRIGPAEAGNEAFGEEVLRLASPFQYCGRAAGSDVRLGGEEIAADERLMLAIGAANRDPRCFGEGSSPGAAGRRHLAFGAGAHSCPAAGFARTVLRAALRSFAMHLHGAEVPADGVAWRDSLGYRGPTRILATWRSAA